MAFQLAQFVKLRPFAYHSTARANLPRIDRLLRLEPAAEIIRKGGDISLLRTRRISSVKLSVDGETVILHDQLPLRVANAELADGWTEHDFVSFLNEHVFFWPGDSTRPVRPGRRLVEYYNRDDVVLRVRTAELVEANPDCVPLFCPFNSGATRQHFGRRVRRDPMLFTPAPTFPRRAHEAMELAFRSPVRLPAAVEIRSEDGGWSALR